MPSAPPPPVQVRFPGPYQVDMPALADSLIPFGRWSAERIAAHLPVVVSFSAEISERLRVLKGYLAPGGWPRQVHTDAMRTARSIVEQMMPLVEKEIVQGVKLMAAAAIRDDGSRAVADRDQVLSIFLASKMLATARALQANRLVGEPALDWGPEFHEMASTFSNRLICGLAFLTREPYGWAGWTDADLWVDERNYRLFAPICPQPGAAIKANSLPPEDIRRLIVPQLLGPDMNGEISFATIRRVAFESWATITPGLILRDEVFVDTETCRDHPNAKACITRIAADHVASRLQQIAPNERWRQLIEMTSSLDSVSFEVEALVREKVPLD